MLTKRGIAKKPPPPLLEQPPARDEEFVFRGTFTERTTTASFISAKEDPMNRTVVLFTMSAILTSMLGGCSSPSATSEGPVGETAQELSFDSCPADVPAALTPAADQTLKTHFTGVGVQIYMCNATATGFAWTFVAPQANLLNEAGTLVGTHFIGPTWQSNDGSAVVAAKAAAATVDATAIPWLLLNVVSHTGDGRFSDVTSIQRLSTVGGLAPQTLCDTTKLGTIAQVPYSADYVFYKTKDHGRVRQCAAK